MSTVDRGAGTPVVLIPGIQGRWEWMGPTIAALSRTHRVLSFSLNDVRGPRYFDEWTRRMDDLIDRAGAPATVIGVSFGGLVAAHYAASRPSRVRHLVIAVTPSPELHLDPRITGAVRRPWLALPLFVSGSIQRLAPEIIAAHDSWPARAAFAARYAARAIRSPLSPGPMAAWVREWMATDIAADCSRISAPTLIITGEPSLDRVVPVHSTMRYLTYIRHSTRLVLPRTGHLGFITRPREFATMVDEFIDYAEAERRAPVPVPSFSGRAV